MTDAELCQHLQALEDAIKWQRARAGLPCGDCQNAPDSKCNGKRIGIIASECDLIRAVPAGC